jgi:hypothetical protein
LLITSLAPLPARGSGRASPGLQNASRSTGWPHFNCTEDLASPRLTRSLLQRNDRVCASSGVAHIMASSRIAVVFIAALQSEPH